jgi:hypothetical protein
MTRNLVGSALVFTALSVLPTHVRILTSGPTELQPRLEPRITWGLDGTTLYAPSLNDLYQFDPILEVGIHDPVAFWSANSTIEACLADASGQEVDWDYQVQTFEWGGGITASNDLLAERIVYAAGAATGQSIINAGSAAVRNRILVGGASMSQNSFYSGIASAGSWIGRAIFANIAVA